MSRARHSAFSAALSLAAVVLLAVPAAGAGPRPTPSGLWEGAILYDPGTTEIDMVVELARTGEGDWSGTIDVLPLRLKFHPLEDISVDGSDVTFWLNRRSPHLDRMVRSPFRGTLSADGSTIEGEFVEGQEDPHPFVLHRIGEAGDPRPEPQLSEVHTFTEGVEGFREAFNRHRDRTRLVMLLSPT